MERSALLPDPNEMKGYQEIDPNSPKQIITIAEREQHIRHISTYMCSNQKTLNLLQTKMTKRHKNI